MADSLGTTITTQTYNYSFNNSDYEKPEYINNTRYNRNSQLNFEDCYNIDANSYFNSSGTDLSVNLLQDYDSTLGFFPERTLKIISTSGSGSINFYFQNYTLAYPRYDFTAVINMNDSSLTSLDFAISNYQYTKQYTLSKYGANQMYIILEDESNLYTSSYFTFNYSIPIYIHGYLDNNTNEMGLSFNQIGNSTSFSYSHLYTTFEGQNVFLSLTSFGGSNCESLLYALDSNVKLNYVNSSAANSDLFRDYYIDYNYDYNYTNTRILECYNVSGKSYELQDYGLNNPTTQYNYDNSSAYIKSYVEDSTPEYNQSVSTSTNYVSEYDSIGSAGNFKLDSSGNSKQYVNQFSSEPYDYKVWNNGTAKSGIIPFDTSFSEFTKTGTDCVSLINEGNHSNVMYFNYEGNQFDIRKNFESTSNLYINLWFNLHDYTGNAFCISTLTNSLSSALVLITSTGGIKYYDEGSTYPTITTVSKNVWHKMNIYINYGASNDNISIWIDNINYLSNGHSFYDYDYANGILFYGSSSSYSANISIDAIGISSLGSDYNYFDYVGGWNTPYDYKLAQDNPKNGVLQWDSNNYGNWFFDDYFNITDINNHKNVLKYNYTKTSSASNYLYFSDTLTAGYIEFYLKGNNSNAYFIAKDGADNLFNIRILNNYQLRLYYAATSVLVNYQTDSFPLISINFDCTTDTYSAWVNGILEVDNQPFFNNNNLDKLEYINLFTNAQTCLYLDSLGYGSNYIHNSNQYRYIDSFVDYNAVNTSISLVNQTTHLNCLKIFDNSTLNYGWLQKDLVGYTNEIWSFNFLSTQINTLSVFILSDSVDSNAIYLGTPSGKLSYYTTGWHYVEDLESNIWYNVKVKINENNFDLYLDGIHLGQFDFRNNPINFNKMNFRTYSTSIYSLYLDQISLRNSSDYFDEYANYNLADFNGGSNPVQIGDLGGGYGINIIDSNVSVSFGTFYNLTYDNHFDISFKAYMGATNKIQSFSAQSLACFFNLSTNPDGYLYYNGSDGLEHSTGIAYLTSDWNEFEIYGNQYMYSVIFNGIEILTNIKPVYEEKPQYFIIQSGLTETSVLLYKNVSISEYSEYRNVLYNSLGAIKFGFIGTNYSTNILITPQSENLQISDYNDFMLGFIIDNPLDYWECSINFGNFSFGIETYPSGFRYYKQWNTTRTTDTYGYNQSQLFPNNEIYVAIGKLSIGSYPYYFIRGFNQNLVQGTIASNTDCVWSDYTPTIKMHPSNSLGNATNNQIIFKGLINKSVDYTDTRFEPENLAFEYRLESQYENEIYYDLSTPISGLSTSYDYRYFKITELNISITPSLENLYNGYVGTIYTSNATNILTTGQNSFLGLNIFEYLQYDNFNATINHIYSMYAPKGTTFSFSITFTIEWYFYYRTHHLGLLETFVQWVAPLLILLIFPLVFYRSFGVKGAIIGFIAGFILLAFTHLVDLPYAIILIGISVILAIVIFKKYGRDL